VVAVTQTAHAEPAALDTVREVVGGATSKVFGHPVTQGGVTLLPVAKVSGGGGGGGGSGGGGIGGRGVGGLGVGAELGQGKAGEAELGGNGGGLAVMAKPLGVFVIKEGKVRWRPALDLNKVILGGQLVMITALLTVRAIAKARARARE
jgi:uncharacterized spore protein YtfJ